ncbi:MAG: hypothetical protein ACI4JD_03620 [Ruminococcus sp.]
MNKNNQIMIKLLYSVSEEISSEEKDGRLYECRRLKKDEKDRAYDIRKKRAAIAEILAKTQRILYND